MGREVEHTGGGRPVHRFVYETVADAAAGPGARDRPIALVSGGDPGRDDASWTFARRAPPPALIGAVRELQGFVERSPVSTRRRESASSDVTLIVDFGARFVLHDLRTGRSLGAHGSFVAGLFDRPTVVDSAPEARCLQAALTPLGARRLLGVPMKELAGRAVALDDLLGPDVGRLRDRLAASKDWATRFATFEGFLARRLAIAPPPPASTAHAWARLAGAGGRVAVGTVAAELGTSPRQLGRQFHEHVGLAPRTAARILRFERARAELTAAETRLVDVALAHGYADHAHLTREFRALSGWPPSRYAAQVVLEGLGVAEDLP